MRNAPRDGSRCTRVALVAALIATTAGSAASQPAGGGRFRHRWVYLSTNLLVDTNVERALAVMGRAARAGYTGIALADSKFMRWGTLPDRYAKNVARVPAAIKPWLADAAKVKGVVGVMYTTWRRRYDDIEVFAARLRD